MRRGNGTRKTGCSVHGRFPLKEIGGQRQAVATLQQPCRFPWSWKNSGAGMRRMRCWPCNGQASEVNDRKEENGCVALEVQSGGFYALAYAETGTANTTDGTAPQTGDANRTAFFWMLLMLSSLGLAAGIQNRKTAVKKH
ncbi:MAG: hypothetical protein ACLT0Y_02210 [Christensenellales bacterium]